MLPNINDEVLTVDEAAQVTKVSTATIRGLISRGKLRAVEIGIGSQRRHHRILKSSLLVLLGLPASHGEVRGTSPSLSPGRAPIPSGYQRNAR